MSSSMEYGNCDICGKEAALERTYFYYPFKCECHSPHHFELVCHCKDCIPKVPQETLVRVFPTEIKGVYKK